MITMTITGGKGSFSTLPIGRVPGGYRVQVSYNAVTFTGATDSSGTGPETAFKGEVLAGTDWVLLRDDGVAVFDGNITFAAKLPGLDAPAHVFDADLSGQVDLKKVGWTSPITSPDDLKRLKGNLEVSLPIQFETSVAAPAGASALIRAAAANGGLFAELAQHQYLATGTFQLSDGQIETAELDVASVAAMQPGKVAGAARSATFDPLPSPGLHDRPSPSGIHDLGNPIDRLIDIALRGDREFRGNKEAWKAFRSVFTDEVIEALLQRYPRLPNAGLKKLRTAEWKDAQKLLEHVQVGMRQAHSLKVAK